MLSLTIALRYLRSSGLRFAGLITWASFTGLLLGVAVLTVVVSVMNGFDDALKSRLLTAIPHAVITLVDDEAEERIRTQLKASEGVTSAVGFFEGVAMVSRGRAVQPVTLFGLDAEGLAESPQIAANVVSGDLGQFDQSDLHPPEIVMGYPLARHLGLRVGDPVTLIVAMPNRTSIAPRRLVYRLGATFEMGAELDVNLVVVPRGSLAKDLRAAIGTEGVRVQVADPFAIDAHRNRFETLGEGISVATWTERYADLFSAVRLEKTIMFVILLLVVAVAAFNLVSGQIMLVRKKASAIAILRTMGASDETLARIFLYQGLLVGLGGIVFGLLLGVVAAEHINTIVGVLENLIGMRFLEGTYFVDIPRKVEIGDLLTIGAIAGVICVLAAYLPAVRARKSSPIEGLHGA